MLKKIYFYKNLSIFFISNYFNNMVVKLPFFVSCLGYIFFAIGFFYPIDFLPFCYPYQSDNTQSFIITIIIGGITVIGIISSLFWTTFSSIYSTKFINTAENLKNLYQRLIPYLQSIINVALFITYSIVLISYYITNNNNYHLFVLWLLLLIFIIIYFSLLSYLAIYYSSNSNLQKLLINDIYKSFNRIICKSFQENMFQEKIKQTILEKVQCLKSFWDIDKNSQFEQTINNLSNYLLQNNKIIEAYWNIKEKIYYKSNWYDRQYIFSSVYHIEKEHMTTHLEIINDFFEVFILSNNIDFINIFFENNEFEKINTYIIQCHDFFNININLTEKFLLLQLVNHIKDKLIKKYKEKNQEDPLNRYFILLNNIIIFYELIIKAYLQEIKKEYQCNINEINFNKLNEEIRNIFLLNNELGEQITKKIKTELQIENTIITPNKYVNNILAIKKYNEIIEALNKILLCYNTIIDFKNYFIENSLLYFSVYYVMLKNKLEFYNEQPKLKEIIKQCKQQDSFLNRNQSTDTDKLLVELSTFNENFFQELIHELPDYNSEQSTAFGKPDLLGYIYKEYCIILDKLINNADEKNFICTYKHFFNFIIFYFDFLHKKINEKKENSKLVKSYYNEFEPLLIYFQLTGFAYITLTNLRDTIFSILTNEKYKSLILSFIESYEKKIIPRTITNQLNHFLFINNPQLIYKNYIPNIIKLLKEHYAI